MFLIHMLFLQYTIKYGAYIYIFIKIFLIWNLTLKFKITSQFNIKYNNIFVSFSYLSKNIYKNISYKISLFNLFYLTNNMITIIFFFNINIFILIFILILINIVITINNIITIINILISNILIYFF